MLVGGSVRDALNLKFKFIPKDFDFIIRSGSLNAAASKVKAELGGTVVQLKFEQTVRVVLRDGVIVDLCAPDGGLLDEDLARRDYTINAIAWSPDEGFLDNHEGIKDIASCTIRATREKNLTDDPLRVLRAYRLAAAMGYKIDTKTRELLKKHAGRLRESASERITEELIRMLNSERADSALRMAAHDGALGVILGCKPHEIMSKLRKISKLRPLKGSATFGLSALGMLRLEILLLGVSLDDTLLTLSNEARKRIEQFSQAYKARLPRAGTRQLYELFDQAGSAASDVLWATRSNLNAELRRFRRIQSTQLISPKELMDRGVERGPKLGRILRELQAERFLGNLKSKKDCLLYMNSYNQH